MAKEIFVKELFIDGLLILFQTRAVVINLVDIHNV